MKTGACPSCHAPKDEAVVFTVPREGNRVEFAGFRCACGHKFWHASPVGPEISEARWRTGSVAHALGLQL